jgi:hypothetical protein
MTCVPAMPHPNRASQSLTDGSQFSHTLPTKNEADRYAAQKAQEWIDKNQKP